MNDLPVGPYLSQLEELDITCVILRSGVPAALLCARQLHTLKMPLIQLTALDMAVLSSLLAIKTMVLPIEPYYDMQDEWLARLAQLRALWRAKGRAPPDIYI